MLPLRLHSPLDAIALGPSAVARGDGIGRSARGAPARCAPEGFRIVSTTRQAWRDRQARAKRTVARCRSVRIFSGRPNSKKCALEVAPNALFVGVLQAFALDQEVAGCVR